LVEFFKSITLSDYGSYASIIGFITAILTFFLVWGIKKNFLFRSQIDEHRESLTKIASEVSGHLENFSENLHNVEESFAIADVKLRNMQKGASKDLLTDIKLARKKISKFRAKRSIFTSNENKSDKLAREIRTQLNIVIEELTLVRKELMVGK